MAKIAKMPNLNTIDTMKHENRNAGRRVSQWILMTVMAIISIAGLTSCYVDDGWEPAPPYGWNDTFYDSRLTGYWKLEQINSQLIDGYEVNFLYFNGNGRGRYYYYDNGQRYWENTAYWCQNSVSGTSNYQINLQYETVGSPTTMNYWFTDNNRNLWMQWRNSGGVQTYVYTYYPGQPW